MQFRKIKGSSVLIVLVIFLIISKFILNSVNLNWDQQKLISLEKMRENDNQDISDLYKNIVEYIESADIHSIDKNEINILYKNRYDIKLNRIFIGLPELNYLQDKSDDNASKVYLYKVDIRSIIDLHALHAYHEKMNIYICVYEQSSSTTPNNLKHKLKVFPISSFI